MEMRDISPIEGQEPEVEKTLNQEPQVEAEAATDAELVVNQDSDPEALAETEMTQAEEEAQTEKVAAAAFTKDKLIEAASKLLEADASEIQRDQVSRLRQSFSALRKVEIDNEHTAWAEAGNDPSAFEPAADPDEEKFNALIAQIREKRNAWNEEQEKLRQKNLEEKNNIIEQICALAEDTDNVNRTFPTYRELQDKFNAIGEVPATEETGVWKRFQEARERYSDNLKINKELRDYDFKKNLDTKLLLIQEAEALDAEEDVITASRRLQNLRDKWRQVGPVAKELREEIWQKFKDAAAVVDKKYQAFFEEKKAKEAENEAAKIALCDKLEALDFTALKNYSGWEEMTKKVIALQEEWKTLGFASRKVNNQLFARFRQRCDEFFSAKAAFFKNLKEEYSANLVRKMALADRAEALKDSTDWRKAADEFVEMQKEWKSIGAVPKKHSDAVWKRFLAACDYFFEKKKAATSGQRTTEQANLKIKSEIIESLKQIDAKAEGALEAMRALQDKWQQTGHVPFKDKDKINDGYRAAVNALRKALNANENRMRMDRFETNIGQIEGDENKLLRERDRLARALETRRAELRTYENNLGFLSSKSKSGSNLVSEFTHKMEKLKEDIASLEEKIIFIDSKL